MSNAIRVDTRDFHEDRSQVKLMHPTRMIYFVVVRHVICHICCIIGIPYPRMSMTEFHENSELSITMQFGMIEPFHDSRHTGGSMVPSVIIHGHVPAAICALDRRLDSCVARYIGLHQRPCMYLEQFIHQCIQLNGVCPFQKNSWTAVPHRSKRCRRLSRFDVRWPELEI